MPPNLKAPKTKQQIFGDHGIPRLRGQPRNILPDVLNHFLSKLVKACENKFAIYILFCMLKGLHTEHKKFRPLK